MWNLKKLGTDNLIYKAETETQTQRTNIDTKAGRGSWMNWEIGVDIYTLLTLYIR